LLQSSRFDLLNLLDSKQTAFHSEGLHVVETSDREKEIAVRKKIYHGIRLMNEAERILATKQIQIRVKEDDPFGVEMKQLLDFGSPLDLVPILSASLDRLFALEKTTNKATSKLLPPSITSDPGSPFNNWLLRVRRFA